MSDEQAELSGVVLLDGGRKLIAVSNEGLGPDGRAYMAQVFEGDPKDGYTHSHNERIYEPDGCKEADFEALAQDDDTLFVIGSHSQNRKKQNKNETRAENFRRLSADGIDEDCKSRDKLRKFRLTDGEKVETLQKTSLRDLVDHHPVLKRFATLPNKENGIDIEGLAVFDGALFVGFRGPVLRENYVPVLRLPTDLDRIEPDGESDGALFVNLGGRGIRDLAPGPLEEKALYILAGPNGDEKQNFAIYRWDGRDQLGGNGHEPDIRQPLCEIDLTDEDKRTKHKPEGLAYLDRTPSALRFVLVHDGEVELKAEIITIRE
ncbi:DUF3616 domain-containing protein [Hyphomicrobium album]|uniref:DUF3616 domain-containing protein n=1 Tax=Hyphomicrobium album TaxID=2665159 RepID=UPI0018AB90D3|nr:DUF3616 domain-containing protein [Hyphomicrobium album]